MDAARVDISCEIVAHPPQTPEASTIRRPGSSSQDPRETRHHFYSADRKSMRCRHSRHLGSDGCGRLCLSRRLSDIRRSELVPVFHGSTVERCRPTPVARYSSHGTAPPLTLGLRDRVRRSTATRIGPANWAPLFNMAFRATCVADDAVAPIVHGRKVGLRTASSTRSAAP